MWKGCPRSEELFFRLCSYIALLSYSLYVCPEEGVVVLLNAMKIVAKKFKNNVRIDCE